MTSVVLVASSPRFPLLFPPQTWRALDAARPVYVLDLEHPSLPALDVGEVAFEVLPVADDSGPAGHDLLLVGQGIDADQVAQARRQADALLGLAKERAPATVVLPPDHEGRLVEMVAQAADRDRMAVEVVYLVGEP